MQERPFAHRGLRSLSLQGAALACLVALFAFIGPFGTYDSMGPIGRLGYWAPVMGANWLVCAGVMALTLRLAASAGATARLLALAGAALAAAVPGTGVVHVAEALFMPHRAGLEALPEIYLGVAALMLAIGVPVVLVLAGRAPAEAEAASGEGEAAERKTAPFLDRLPPELGRDLIRLRMADHYVEAFTTAGSTLVLMRFADAVAELEAVAGSRVHRSHWVAKAHVTGTLRRNGRTILRLTDGHEAPVSRGFLPAARRAGLV